MTPAFAWAATSPASTVDRMRTAPGLLVVAAFLAIVACKKHKPETDVMPADSVDRDELLRETRRVAQGEDVGAALADPVIVVDARGLTVNGRTLLLSQPLTVPITESKRLMRIDEEFNWLEGLREHWKEIHAGTNFPGNAEVTLADDTSLRVADSVLQTAAVAGFPNVHVTSGGVSFAARMWIPGAPPPDGAPASARLAVVTVRPGAGSWSYATTVKNGAACEHTPESVLGDALSSPVNAVCTEGVACVISVGAVDGTFADVAAKLAPVLAARAPGTTSIAIGQPDLDECAAPPKDDLWGAAGAGPPGAPVAGKGVLRAGSLSVNGRLPPEVVARVVRQNQSHVTACYQNGLRSNPNLQGRVVVKFVIDPSGAVKTASDGGSDLPDPQVVQCIVRAVKDNLTFPQPEGGVVTVVYPLTLSPF
jgi:hypothetical protein